MARTGSVRNVNSKRCSAVRPARRSRYFCSKVVRRRRRSWRTDSTSVRCAPRDAASAQLNLVAILPPVRHVGDEIETERSPVLQDPRDGRERRDEIAIAEEGLQDAVRREHQRKLTGTKRKSANVAANERQTSARVPPAAGPHGPGARGRAAEHGRGSIDPDERDARPRQRQRDPSGSAAELER